jgi:hypothetical protein
MTVDIVCGFLLVLFVGLGYKSGAVVQLVRIGGLVIAYLSAPRLADLAAESEPILHFGLTALAFSAIYTGVAIAGHFLLSNDQGPSKKDRLAGAGIGLVKAVALSCVLAISLHILAPDLKKFDPEDRVHVQESMVVHQAGIVRGWVGI